MTRSFRETTWKRSQDTSLFTRRPIWWRWSGHRTSWWTEAWGSLIMRRGDMRYDSDVWFVGMILNQIWFLHSVYWDFAITIRLEEIVYLHCHQHGEYKKYDLYIILKISVWICVKLSFISVDFQHHYCSLQGHMIFRNHNNMKHFWLLSMLKKLPRKSNFKFKT